MNTFNSKAAERMPAVLDDSDRPIHYVQLPDDDKQQQLTVAEVSVCWVQDDQRAD